MTARSGSFMKVVAGLTLAVLLLHAWSYFFLTDDAYISFRYARNLSHGHGLVFNPGMERVEGYTNFLWVLALAALDLIGLAPEHTANVISLLLTVALWAIMARHLWRQSDRPGRDWAMLVPLAALAACRSFAVWSTSGLETRAFELLVTAGVLRLARESGAEPGARLVPWGGVLLGLASMTRPDGILVACAAFGTVALMEMSQGRFRVVATIARAWPLAALVCAHIAFRLAYYHEWVPNTYFAKVGGRLMWVSGLRYLAAFVLEYSLWLWIPLLIAGVVRGFRRKTAMLPVMCVTVVAAHTAYVVAIGGDHFEYRPLNLWFPLLALVLADGVREWAGTPRRSLMAGIYAAALIAGMFLIPNASRGQFPDRYMPGFPGVVMKAPEAIAFLDPARDPVLRLPPMNVIARVHRDLTRYLTRHFVAIRQEEHRMFLQNAGAEARRLRGLIDRGVLPQDVFLAMSSVGVIPYITDAPTLDRVGLTDSTVAHSGFTSGLMAHGKMATMDYARKRGVDLWFCDPVYGHQHLVSPGMIGAAVNARRFGEEAWAAEVAPDLFLLCRLPQGPESAAKRMPRLQFRSMLDPVFRAEYCASAIVAQQAELAESGGSVVAAFRMAELLFCAGRYAEAEPFYRAGMKAVSGDIDAIGQYSQCQVELGDRAGAAESVAGMCEVAERRGKRSQDVETLARNLKAIESAMDSSSAESRGEPGRP